MKIKEIIKREGKSISFEFFPPKNKKGEEQLFGAVGKLELLKPGFVSVTYGAGGSTQTNTRYVVQRIKEETSLTVMPHLTCIGQSQEELKGILHDYRGLGIENILVLRGDHLREQPSLTRSMACVTPGTWCSLLLPSMPSLSEWRYTRRVTLSPRVLKWMRSTPSRR
jgi:methylenetetrahydrofolate reductase (NADPH)